MCAQFYLKIKNLKFLQALHIAVPESYGPAIDHRFLPSQMAPVVVFKPQTHQLILYKMKFSLIPSWSKEPRVKFATHNARIETVLDKPTWKIPFENKHCLIPMTAFYESVYKGPEAGNIIEFSQVDDSVLWAAGIYDLWRSPDQPENFFYSFSILTRPPPVFVQEHGHDRCPLFLNFKDGQTWVQSLSQAPAQDSRDFLISKWITPDFKVTKDRALKPGWEKRR